MQLLDTEQLEYAFQVHGINREGQARQFYADLWALIQRAEKSRTQEDLGECERELRALCRVYFSQMFNWRREESERHELSDACGPSQNNAREASQLLHIFERQFFRYALCYMELNRALIQIRARVSHYAKDCNIESEDILEVNHGTGALLARAHAQRLELMEKRLRLDRVKHILAQFDPLMERLGRDLPQVYGHAEGDHQLTLFKGALRRGHFDIALVIAQSWKKKDLSEAGLKITGMAQKNAAELKAQDRLMLHTGELSLIAAFLREDEARANQFLDKFNVPYMVFQYKNLLHQGYLLGHVGSIEGLIIMHAKLVSLASRLHNDPASAQAQEQAVLVPARAQVQTRFKSLGAIFNDMETTLAILEKFFAQTREYRLSGTAQ